MFIKNAPQKDNLLTLVPRLTRDVEAVEKSFDELATIIKDKKIRAFSCTVITLDGEAINHFAFDTDNNFFALIGATEVLKNNMIKENIE